MFYSILAVGDASGTGLLMVLCCVNVGRESIPGVGCSPFILGTVFSEGSEWNGTGSVGGSFIGRRENKFAECSEK